MTSARVSVSIKIAKSQNVAAITLEQYVELFDSITIEYGALISLCAEGAPLPSWDAGAEIQDRVTRNCRPDSGRPQPRKKELHTLLSAHRIGSLQTNGQEPKQTVREKKTTYGRTTTCTCGCHHDTDEANEPCPPRQISSRKCGHTDELRDTLNARKQSCLRSTQPGTDKH